MTEGRDRKTSSTLPRWGILHAWMAQGPHRKVEVAPLASNLAVVVVDGGDPKCVKRVLEVVMPNEDPSQAALRAMQEMGRKTW